MKKVILVIAAHPDDEILGCSATVARLIREGYIAYTLILSKGIEARNEKYDRNKRKKEIDSLSKQMKNANRILGINKLFIYDFPDNRFDGIDLLDIVKVIEKVKNEIKPEIIFTHYEKDLNIDHRITYQAVITATRPQPSEIVREIYSFETLSATEWAYPLSFSPDVFFDITDTIDVKVRSMSAYTSELQNFPHPRSLKSLQINAQHWGFKIGVSYAEAFKCVRIIR